MLISFEGIDGCGKDTLINALSKFLASKGKKVFVVGDLFGSVFKQKISELVLGKIEGEPLDSKTKYLLFLAARSETCKLIKQKIAEGYIVICNRYTDSTIAYQGYGEGRDIQEVIRMCDFASDVMPDITFLLDAPIEICLARTSKDEFLKDKNLQFFQKVRNGFLTIQRNNSRRVKLVSVDLPFHQLKYAFIVICRHLSDKIKDLQLIKEDEDIEGLTKPLTSGIEQKPLNNVYIPNGHSF